MKLIAAQREASFFLLATLLLALYILLSPGTGNDWALDPITGVVAAATALTLCGRLALGATSRTARQFWQVVVVILTLVCISQVTDPFSDEFQEYLGIEDVDDGLMLLAAPFFLWLSARFDPLPRTTRQLLWAAFVCQVVATGADLIEDESALSSQAFWSALADFFDLLSMQCYLLSAALFVSALRLQILSANRGVASLGDLARYLFATHRLFKKQRYPRNSSLALPGGKAALEVGRFVVWFLRTGPRVRDAIGLSLWQQFLQICVIGFRHGLDAQAYYMFELYRHHNAARAAGFLTRYETKNGLFKVLTRQVPKGGHRSLLGDKVSAGALWAQNGIPHVPTLIVAQDGRLDIQCDDAALARDLFIKPRQLKGARNTEVLRYVGGEHVGDDGAGRSLPAVLDALADRSRGGGLLVQPRIRNHPGIADLAQDSLIVVRVVTCLDARQRPVVTHGMLRVLCKLEQSWPTDIELGAPIDLRRGTLGRMTGDKAEMVLDWHAEHPITGARVLGRQVPCWDEVCEVAMAGHRACGDRLLIGWDIAISPDGPLLVEGNAYADVDFLQRVARRSIGDSPLGPLLFARLTALESKLLGARRDAQ